MKTRTLLALACLFVAGFARGEDTLTLQDGTTHKGKVIARDGTYTVLAGKKVFQFYRADVKEVNGQPIVANDPVALIKTDEGDIKVALYQDEAPNTVANFVTLAEAGFFKGMSFHRVIPGFMAQGGCPESKEGAKGRPGTGGPGYSIRDEFHPRLLHSGRGILSMANSGPNTGGSQFFVCFAAVPDLDGKHTVFGRVIEGIEVLDKLEAVGTQGDGSPTKTIRFDVQVLSKRDTPYQVAKIEKPARKPRPPAVPTTPEPKK